MFKSIKKWFALKRASKEERKNIPSKKDIVEEHNQFIESEIKAHDALVLNNKSGKKVRSIKIMSKSTSKKSKGKTKKAKR